MIELTEEDMEAIANSRFTKEASWFLMRWLFFTFVPFAVILFLGGSLGIVLAPLWVIGAFILLRIKTRRQEKRIAALAKELWREWRAEQIEPS